MSERRHKWILALFIALFFFLLSMTEGQAEGAELNGAVGSSHSVVSALGLDARAAALGWAVTAVDLGAAGLSFNPAAAALVNRRQLYMGHVDWVLDSSLSQGAALLPVGESSTVSAELLYFDQGTVDEVLDDGTYTGERLGARDLHFSMGLGHRFPSGFSFGARFTVFHKSLGWERASGMQGSLGLLTGDMDGFRLGAAIQGLGPSLRFREVEDPAPLRYRLGMAHTVGVSGQVQMQNSLDFVIPRDNYSSFHVGTEWEYAGLLALRAGYRRSLLDDGSVDGDRFSYGAGFRLGDYRFDYSYSPKDDFDPVHRFSVNFSLGISGSHGAASAGNPALLSATAATDSTTVIEIDYAPLPRVTVLKGITFDLNSSEINTSSRPLLTEVLGRLKSTPGVEAVEIQGHTDNSGEEPFNRRLSLQRARAVRDFFMSEGYPPSKLGVMGFGSTRSLSGNETPEGRAANRRIEIHLIRRVPG